MVLVVIMGRIIAVIVIVVGARRSGSGTRCASVFIARRVDFFPSIEVTEQEAIPSHFVTQVTHAIIGPATRSVGFVRIAAAEPPEAAIAAAPNATANIVLLKVFPDKVFPFSFDLRRDAEAIRPQPGYRLLMADAGESSMLAASWQPTRAASQPLSPDPMGDNRIPDIEKLTAAVMIEFTQGGRILASNDPVSHFFAMTPCELPNACFGALRAQILDAFDASGAHDDPHPGLGEGRIPSRRPPMIAPPS